METLVQIQQNNMPEISTGSRFLDDPAFNPSPLERMRLIALFGAGSSIYS